jgi:peroxiredoxin
MLKTGDRAPEFEMKDIGGVKQSLGRILENGPAVFVFFKVSCPTCQFTMPFVERIAGGSKRFFAISQDDASTTRKFMRQFGLTLPVLLDTNKEKYVVSNGFKIYSVPSFFALAADGTIEKSFTGFVKANLEEFGKQSGVEPFRPDEQVPSIKPG